MINLPSNFFSHYWQKKPLLLSKATQWRPDITPDELAGIACEESSEARIILEHQDAARWELMEGPFEVAQFSQLPKSHWTLLVQNLESWDEQVAELLSLPVIPQWRIQDVMCSYAVDQGSVGPHFDHYDVFLVQGLGHRRWKIGPKCDERTPLLKHPDLLLLKNMAVTKEYLLEPGDIMYIPPGYAHWGVAEGECMTFSIGFRAPSAAQAFQELCDQITPGLPDHRRYTDSAAFLHYHENHRRHLEIAPLAIEQVRQLIMDSLDDTTLARWLGHRSTAQNRLPSLEPLPDERFETLWRHGLFCRHPELQILWHQGHTTALYCHGIHLTIKTGLSGPSEADFLEQFASETLLNIHKEPYCQIPVTRTIVRWLLELEALEPYEISE